MQGSGGCVHKNRHSKRENSSDYWNNVPTNKQIFRLHFISVFQNWKTTEETQESEHVAMRQLQPTWHMLAISLHHKISISKGSQSELPWYDAQSRSILNGWQTYKRANRPALVLNCTVEPGISDHQIVVAENKLIAQRRKPLHRKIILWKRADYAELRKEVKSLENSISEKFDRTTPINIVWNIFLKEIKEIQDRCVPSKTASVSFHQPWITTNIKRLSRSKRKAYR